MSRTALIATVVFSFVALLIPAHESLAQLDPSKREGFVESLEPLTFRYVGPTRGGRVTAVAGTRQEPGTFYMGSTGGGVWKTTDYGTSWHNVSDGFFGSPSIGVIRVAQSDPNIVYVGTGSDGLRSNVIPGDGVYKSIDAGATWTHVGLDTSGHIGRMEIDPRNHNVVFVAAIGSAFGDNAERGVFRTRDGGASWEKVLFLSDSTGFYDVEFMPSNPDIVYATAWRAERKPWTIISGGSENGIYRSIDGGDNWKRVGDGLPSLMGKIDLATSAADSRIVWANVEAPGDSTGLYKSVDHGASFEHISSDGRLLERAFYYTNLQADPTDANVLHSLATRYVKSTDGGKSWQSRSAPHGDHHDMWINPDNPNLLIQSNDGGANVSFNGGETWSTQFNQPTAELYQVEVDEQYPYWLYAGQQDNYSAIAVPSNPPLSHQIGATGLIANAGGCETGPAVPRPDDANIIYANCKGRFTVYNRATGQEQQYNVGGQYMYGHNPADLTLRFQRVSPIHISPHNPDRVYHTSQYVHVSEDGGQSWNTISPDLTAFESDKQVISGSPITRDITGEEFYSTIYSIRESPVTPGLLWVGANDGPVHVTRDSGRTWVDVTPRGLPPGGRIDAVEPSPHDPAVAYFAALRYMLGDPQPYLYRTTDYGESWTKIVTGIPENASTRVIREDPHRRGLLYAGTDAGLYVSFDDGNSWHAFQQNLPVTPITDIKIHRKDLVLSTMGRGFWILYDLSSLHQEVEQFVGWALPASPASAADDRGLQFFAPRETYRYRYGFGSERSTGLPQPDYERPGAIFDYVLPPAALSDSANAAVRLQIFDLDNQVVRALTTEENGAASRDDNDSPEDSRDMATNQIPYVTSGQLTMRKGLNRFRWDMRRTGPWHESTSRRWSGGVTAAPGLYVAEMSVEWDAADGMRRTSTVRQQFELLMDPRVRAAGVSDSDIEAQVALADEAAELLSAARRLSADVDDALERAKKDSTGESATRVALQTIHDALETADGRYPQPMLLSQISYVYGMLDRADQRPGNDMYERLRILRGELDALDNEFQRVTDAESDQ